MSRPASESFPSKTKIRVEANAAPICKTWARLGAKALFRPSQSISSLLPCSAMSTPWVIASPPFDVLKACCPRISLPRWLFPARPSPMMATICKLLAARIKSKAASCRCSWSSGKEKSLLQPDPSMADIFTASVYWRPSEAAGGAPKTATCHVDWVCELLDGFGMIDQNFWTVLRMFDCTADVIEVLFSDFLHKSSLCFDCHMPAKWCGFPAAQETRTLQKHNFDSTQMLERGSNVEPSQSRILQRKS